MLVAFLLFNFNLFWYSYTCPADTLAIQTYADPRDTWQGSEVKAMSCLAIEAYKFTVWTCDNANETHRRRLGQRVSMSMLDDELDFLKELKGKVTAHGDSYDSCIQRWRDGGHILLPGKEEIGERFKEKLREFTNELNVAIAEVERAKGLLLDRVANGTPFSYSALRVFMADV